MSAPEKSTGQNTPPAGSAGQREGVGGYEPPAITLLGTLAELTEGHNAGINSDLTFPASGVGTRY
ncbi:MAG: lasso RiPP family leader peptide-containing protein [Solirubrobacteraceae bacterium]|jgi:hypothetical protein